MQPDEIDSGYLWDMRAFTLTALAFVEGHTLQDLQDDLLLRFAMERAIENIGEAARQVSREFQARHPEVPWQAIVDQRNFLAHGYLSIDVARLWDVIQAELPVLLAQLNDLIPHLSESDRPGGP